jgi:hypothetical protein
MSYWLTCPDKEFKEFLKFREEFKKFEIEYKKITEDRKKINLIMKNILDNHYKNDNKKNTNFKFHCIVS